MTHSLTTIVQLDTTQARAMLPGLVALLQDAVQHGASVGFLAPLTAQAALEYWLGVIRSISDTGRMIWIALYNNTVVGTVQLVPCMWENGRHRAQVQQLFVLHSIRRMGLASRLMHQLEQDASTQGIRTLHLDTECGSQAEAFYQRMGYTRSGAIPDYSLTSQGQPSDGCIYYKSLNSIISMQEAA